MGAKLGPSANLQQEQSYGICEQGAEEINWTQDRRCDVKTEEDQSSRVLQCRLFTKYYHGDEVQKDETGGDGFTVQS